MIFSSLILSSGELFFQPGVRELEIAVNIIDDDVPEEEEHFRVSLKNPKGGAEIGFRGQVTLFIPANDDAYGIISFAQVLYKDQNTLCASQMLLSAQMLLAEYTAQKTQCHGMIFNSVNVKYCQI